tara:strand:- start:50 stop:205 length:156 start_codon:yes stop_codon:yes gene_type:complete
VPENEILDPENLKLDVPFARVGKGVGPAVACPGSIFTIQGGLPGKYIKKGS